MQEVAAQVMLSEVSATCRARIKSLDDIADDRVGTFVHVLSTLGLSHSALAVETLQQAKGSQGLPRLFPGAARETSQHAGTNEGDVCGIS